MESGFQILRAQVIKNSFQFSFFPVYIYLSYPHFLFYTASAFAFFGYGLGGFFFNEFATFYINPSNYSPDISYDTEHEKEK